MVPCSLADLVEHHGGIDPFENDSRFVADDYIEGSYRVSTIFLMLDHNFFGRCLGEVDHKPMWFETMVFTYDGKSRWSARYETYIEAQQGHAAAIEMARGWVRESENAR